MDSVHVHHHRVSYAECTVGDHVYYARYLDMLEQARGDLFREAAIPLSLLARQNLSFPVIESRISYLASARYDDRLVIESWISSLGRVQLAFEHRILHEDSRPLVRASTTHVCADAHGKPRRIPEAIRSALAPHVKASAETAEASPAVESPQADRSLLALDAPSPT